MEELHTVTHSTQWPNVIAYGLNLKMKHTQRYLTLKGFDLSCGPSLRHLLQDVPIITSSSLINMLHKD